MITSIQEHEWYFVIEDKNGIPIGTYKISNVTSDMFSLGSWVMNDGVSFFQTIEGEYLVRKFGFDVTHLDKFNFMVYANNSKVIKYHKLMGANVVKEEDNILYFESDKETYLSNLKKYFPEIFYDEFKK